MSLYRVPVFTKKILVGFAKVDRDDYPLAACHRWYLHHGYPRSTGSVDGKQIWFTLHRLLMGLPNSWVDHKNTDRLDCRRNNLRLCSPRENAHNMRIGSRNTSGYKGVSWWKTGKKWHAQITVNRKVIHLGYFDDIIEAAAAYNRGSLKYHKEFSRLNKGI